MVSGIGRTMDKTTERCPQPQLVLPDGSQRIPDLRGERADTAAVAAAMRTVNRAVGYDWVESEYKR